MNKILEFKPIYLEKTESWLWEYLRNLKLYIPYVICEQTKNLDLFPLNNISKLNKPPFFTKILGSMIRAFIPRHLAIEGKLAKKIEQIKPVLIHAHYGPSGVYSVPLSKKFGIPLIVSFYGFDISYLAISQRMRKVKLPWDKIYWKKAYQSLWKQGDIFTVTCAKMKDDLVSIGAPKDKVVVLHLGVDLSKYALKKVVPTKSPTILIANRFVSKKGTEYAIRAFAEVLKKYQGAKLKIIGDGPLKEGLAQLVSNLNIAQSTEFLGILPFDSYMSYMSQADIFLSPSVKVEGDEEGGVNTTVIQAMAVGTIVFATEESGQELIINNKTGFMVVQKNENDLAEKIINLINVPNSWSEIALNARKHVEEEFDSIKQARELENIYFQVTKKIICFL